MITLFALIAFLTGFTSFNDLSDEQLELREIVERLYDDPLVDPTSTEKIHLPNLMMDLYQISEFNRVWKDDEQVNQLLEILANSKNHGLNPEDYHYSKLLEYKEERKEDLTVSIYYDIVLSDAAFLYSHHITRGKVRQSEVGPTTWNFPKRENYLEYIEVFHGYVITSQMAKHLIELEPDLPLYHYMVDERKKLDQLQKDKGEFIWIPDQTVIKPGSNTEVFPEIMKRINLLGYSDAYLPTELYDSTYMKDVINFQLHHGLDGDGVIGRSTFDMLNLSIDQRKDMIDVNLERIRWAISAEKDEILVVNIAGFHLYLFRDGEQIWDTDVMTGAIDTQTPVFVSDMKYVVFNPTWTVPRSIIKKSMFQRIKNDPTYLKRNNYYLVNRAGDRVDANSIDWANMTINKFGYSVVQAPGPGNALGRVKFIFPNKYSIYLHDTPSKYLFEKSSRAFSHGCIRVKDPLKLAEILLNDKDGYDQEGIAKVLEQGDTKTVFLTEPLRVGLIYLTVDDTADGSLVYHKDIYSWDSNMLSMLQKKIE